jgi:hypothetical protein
VEKKISQFKKTKKCALYISYKAIGYSDERIKAILNESSIPV